MYQVHTCSVCTLCRNILCRALTETVTAGAGGGQSWDPFRPVRDLQPTPVLSDVVPASGSGAAYTRTSLSKLVLQNTASDVKTSKAQHGSKEGLSQYTGQAAHLAKSACPIRPSAAQAVHISGAIQGQTTQQSGAERCTHTAGRGAAAAAYPQPKPSNSSTAKGAVRHPRRSWQRQSNGVPSPAKQSTLQIMHGRGQTESRSVSSVSALQQHALKAQRQPNTPRFVRSRGNQLVRLSSASPAYTSLLLRSGRHSLPHCLTRNCE